MKHIGWLLPALLVLPALPANESDPSPEAEATVPAPRVATATSCASCHSNSRRASAMRDAAGRPIAPVDLWESSMMANSARDPFWRAAVAAEVAATPSRQQEIERKCLRCHSPMADFAELEAHGLETPMDGLSHDCELGDLARDGVSCTVCHGILPDGLGTQASFTGGFELDTEGRLFGPHERAFAMPMRRHSGFTPTAADHVTGSALCASCHTLETHALHADGEPVGATLLEQGPYLEWLNSDYSINGSDRGPLAASCQDCHVPTTDEDGATISTRIARNPGGRNFPPTRPREPYGRHLFVGGNTTVLELLRDHPDELDVNAPASAFQATIDATREQLEQRTARVRVRNATWTSGSLAFDVLVENLTGHKLPSGHPSRRAWLEVVVRDEDRVVFASGRVDSEGRLVDGDGRVLSSERAGGPIAPHVTSVSSPSQVARFRAVMADAEGRPTHTLLRGASWMIDDRVLPLGWRVDGPHADRTAPRGLNGDADFVGGSDGVHYAIELPPVLEAPTVEVRLLYQAQSARWLQELYSWRTEEAAELERLLQHADRSPEVLASASWSP